jgi:hypothetical protein
MAGAELNSAVTLCGTLTPSIAAVPGVHVALANVTPQFNWGAARYGMRRIEFGGYAVRDFDAVNRRSAGEVGLKEK